MLAGFGAIIGFRAGASLLLGGIVAWGVLGPWGLSQGFVAPGENDLSASWFPSMIEWLLWPGVTLMVASRVVGETGIPPIGAIGKVSQLTTGSIGTNRWREPDRRRPRVARHTRLRLHYWISVFSYTPTIRAPSHT